MSPPGLTCPVLMFHFGRGRYINDVSYPNLEHLSLRDCWGHCPYSSMFQPYLIATNMQTLLSTRQIRQQVFDLSGNSHKPIELSMACIIPNNAAVGARAPCTSHRLNTSYGWVFTGTLLFLQARICLDYAIYNGNNQSLWL